MTRKKTKKRRVTHSPSLKASLKRRGKRLAHGYEIVPRKKKSARKNPL